MEVYFRDKRLQRLLTDDRACSREFGSACARKIKIRLLLLDQAATLEELQHAPGRCHALKGDRKGQFAVDLTGGFRLIFAAADDPVPTRPDGSLDLRQVCIVEVLEVIDYHD
ncbi:MAG: type II toxin-antitoxin system RelE/ParE family toxin [Armatimonadia bacterium]